MTLLELIEQKAKARAEEPVKQVQFRIPLSWWNELRDLSWEFDQNVSTFLREATMDWLQRAREVRQKKINSEP